jgi:hypothetical protein
VASAEAEDRGREFASSGGIGAIHSLSVWRGVGLRLGRCVIPFLPVCCVAFTDSAAEPHEGDGLLSWWWYRRRLFCQSVCHFIAGDVGVPGHLEALFKDGYEELEVLGLWELL